MLAPTGRVGRPEPVMKMVTTTGPMRRKLDRGAFDAVVAAGTSVVVLDNKKNGGSDGEQRVSPGAGSTSLAAAP